jgi:hypothetical protein
MLKYIITGVLLVVLNSTFACDVCGGASGLQGVGFLPNSNFHFIGLSYKFNSFDTEHPKLFETDPIIFGENTYKTMELWGRYKVSDKFQVFGFVPYHSKRIKDEKIYELEGLGDISLLVNYQLLKRANFKMFLGAGLKMPTGKSNQIVQNVLVPNLQLGTGTFDGLVTTNLTYLKSEFGVNSELNYTLNTKSSSGYKFGNQIDGSILGLYKKQFKKYMLIPQVGIKYYHKSKDITSVKYNIKEVHSGQSYLNIPIGLDFYTKKVGVRLLYEIPVAGEMSEGYVNPKANAKAQVLFIINKKQKIKSNETNNKILNLNPSSTSG